jgi:pyrroloquinoline-quinone synthase
MDVAIETVSRIDARIVQKHLLLHPFYQAWTCGKLPGPALVDYAKQYYHHVAAFPTYLSALHSHTEDAAARRHILSNLADEEAGHPNHPELWLQFAAALGLSREDVSSTQPWAETRQLVGTFRSLCRDGSTVAGLAALYAYESQIPKVAEAKLEGLRRFYGFSQPEGVAYFKLHIEADREHSRVERELLRASIDPATAPAAAAAADSVLERLWAFLSAVGRRHAIPEDPSRLM